jgi:hypothetical protein
MNSKQALALAYPAAELFYGGAAFGGKSVALLAGALQYIDVPGYAALLLRRTFPDLNKPKALIPLSHEWLAGTEARWNEQKHQWTFPSGATLSFGFLDTERDKYTYQGAAYQYIGFDELTQFTKTMYLYLFSRLRRVEGFPVPLRMRAASNPGGIGHEWVRKRFIAPHNDPERVFIPAKLEDNPHADQEQYEKSLNHLDTVERLRLRHGDWDVVEKNGVFNAENLSKMRRFLIDGISGSIVLSERAA